MARRSALVLALCLLSACGRIGVEILPFHDDGVGGDADNGGTNVDGGDELDGAAESGVGVIDMDGGVDTDAASDPIALCMMSCQNAHGSANCATGSCVTSCANGYGDCDRNTSNGCETDTMASAGSCGSCQLSCANPHGSTACTLGVCAPSCASGFADCDGDTDNGCETDLSAAPSCGSCDTACSNAHGTTSCQAGACVPSCAAGFADCDGNKQNGCETNINSDPMHCGSCPNACGTNGQICSNGSCQASPCAAGRAECDGNLAVTCETDTTSSLTNCGFCGNTCTTTNGTPRCTSSACGVQSCNSGFGNCDNSPTNGCEVTLATSTSNCGACGAACTNAHGTTRCTASACVPTCSSGFGDCDTSRPNGCETALDTTSNCGMCGRACPANGGTAVCQAGVCNTICDLTGTYALKMSVTDSWNSDTYIRSGSGTFNFWMRLTGTHSGTSFTGTLTECGRYVPPFAASMLSETYSFQYPNSLFDNNTLPGATATITLANSSPGATFTLADTATQLGIDMALSTLSRSPVTGAWPTQASQIPSSNRIDMDNDGNPGVTAVYENSGSFSHPPASQFGSPRADNPYVASRVSFRLSGMLSSCTQSSGTANFNYIDTRIYACSLESGSCNGTQASFLDSNCVDYGQPFSAGTYTLVKVANGASCATVRAAVP